ncbi:MAG: hypothetical protein KIT69_01970 [Propionibacteriaceae bacterium]|nr:hypothetical protein [Actinomycetota bacterium]MCW5951012.1 hypothetical protein [Propionibacteriaceae bacterium]
MSLAAAVRGPDLKLSYARARLAEVERMRQVYLAALDGMPQREIANAAHLSQATVHRMILRAKALDLAQDLIEEIALQRFVGQISTEVMLERLRGYENWRPRVVDPVDGVIGEDSRGELEALLDDGLLAEAEVDLVLDAHE